MNDASFANSGAVVANNTSVTTPAPKTPLTSATSLNNTTSIITTTTTTTNNSTIGDHGMGTKPRLSLLSTTKQSGIRIKSEDSTDQQINIPSVDAEEYANIVNKNTIPNSEVDKRSRFQREAAAETTNKSFRNELESQQPVRNVLQQQTSEDNKMNIPNEDLLRVLSILKSELHSKEIALAAIKCEQLKRLINPVEISRSSLANTYIELQDRFRLSDQQHRNNNATKEAEQRNQQQSQQPKSASTAKEQAEDFMKMYMKGQEIDESDRENLNILNTLLELLDRHPLLALPRDSIYCLDYNCNELSTKNYLNLKIQHLDNLINQHRRYRYYMNERLKRSEQRYLDLTQELELERNLKTENEKSMFRASGKSVLLRHIDILKEDLEKVKKDKQAIVMTLLNDLLDERERIEDLEQKLANFETASVRSLQNSAGAQQKIDTLESQLNSVNSQLKKQTLASEKERGEFQAKLEQLEAENASIKAKLERLEVRSSTHRDSDTLESKESPSRPPIAPKLSANQHKQNALEAANQRNSSSPGVLNAKSPITKAVASTLVQSSTNKAPTQSHSNNGSPHANIPPKPVITSSLNKTTGSPVASTRMTGIASTESAPVRVQPLFKSASVLSTNQQVRNLKTSTSVGSNVMSSANNSSARNASTNNQPVTKPQVPAKPAQLWEQQRNSIN